MKGKTSAPPPIRCLGLQPVILARQPVSTREIHAKDSTYGQTPRHQQAMLFKSPCLGWLPADRRLWRVVFETHPERGVAADGKITSATALPRNRKLFAHIMSHPTEIG